MRLRPERRSFSDTGPLPLKPFTDLTPPRRPGAPFSGHPTTAIDRTAYPRPGARLTRDELDERYGLTEADLAFVHATARGKEGCLLLAVLLKARQDLGLFPAPDELHAGIVAHLAAQLGIGAPAAPDWARRTKSLYRYQAAVRAYL